MEMHIVISLDVKTTDTNIEAIESTHVNALNELMKVAEKNRTDGDEIMMVGSSRVEIHNKNQGYVYSTKNLTKVYKIVVYKTQIY